jgi:hypothetical protein
MKRLAAWLSGAAGGIAVYRWLVRDRAAVPEVGPDPRAEELRAKLEASKPLVEEQVQVETESRETPVDQAPDPEERRRRVHERGRSTIDRMRRRAASDDG